MGFTISTEGSVQTDVFIQLILKPIMQQEHERRVIKSQSVHHPTEQNPVLLSPGQMDFQVSSLCRLALHLAKACVYLPTEIRTQVGASLAIKRNSPKIIFLSFSAVCKAAI